MGDEAMVVAIVAIACGTGVVLGFMNMVKEAILRRTLSGRDELIGELRSLRDEVRQLRQQNNDVILSLDSSLNRVDRRLTHLETRGQLGAGSPSEAERPVAVIREA